MVVEGPDRYGWSLVGGFDPDLPFVSEEDGNAAFRRRNGKANAVIRPSCPYTNKTVTLQFKHGLWWPTGEFFRPYAPWKHREELVYRASFKAGRTRMTAPDITVIQYVGDKSEEQSDPMEGLDGGKSLQPVIEEYLL